MMCHVCAAEGYPYDPNNCKSCEYNPSKRMVSIANILSILDNYMICDGLYRDVDKTEILCKLIAKSAEIPNKEPEEWFE